MSHQLISGYVTARSVVSMGYPYEACIKSLLQFCDEVIVLNTTVPTLDHDNTFDRLLDLEKQDKRLKVYHENIDWDAPNHGIYDGQSKALARSLCNGRYLFQCDMDEVVHEKHAQLILDLVTKDINWSTTQLVALPVIEYWGSSGKVRIDVNLWKWRLSLNDPSITHGIPIQLRKTHNGLLYASPGTDGCDYIYGTSGMVVPCSGYVPSDLERIKNIAIYNEQAIPIVERFVNDSIQQLPGVFHYSWWSISRKIKQYKQFWHKSWKSLYNLDMNERTNPFFPGLTWDEVTDEMIDQKAYDLEQNTSGWIFHQPWNGSKTNGIRVNMDHPALVKSFLGV